MIVSITHIIPFIFLLTTSILSNFIGDTMGCKIQKLFSNNIILKYIIILFIIYSTITVLKKTLRLKNILLRVYIY